ncbi:MAG: hypothetical protein IPO64_11180 [Bacteroidetes bacterium]|nr:hypothetical protein [Bacteroidota bacterium]
MWNNRFFSLTNKIQIELGENATQKLQFRGPDNQAVYTDENIGLGHARLSIIDTSSAAHQPFWDISSNYCIIFNGEIFNYQKLKEKNLLIMEYNLEPPLIRRYYYISLFCLAKSVWIN